MGKNKLQKFDDMNSFSHVFQFPFSTLREKGFEMKGKWNSDFFKNNNPIVLELGCGKGEYAVGLARKYPEKNFIGVDIKGARMWTGAKDALKNGIANVAFLRTNIELITEFFAENRNFRDLDYISRSPNEKSPEKTHFNPFHGSIPTNT